MLLSPICYSPQKDGVEDKCAKFIGKRTDSYWKRERATFFCKFIVEAAATV